MWTGLINWCNRAMDGYQVYRGCLCSRNADSCSCAVDMKSPARPLCGLQSPRQPKAFGDIKGAHTHYLFKSPSQQLWSGVAKKYSKTSPSVSDQPTDERLLSASSISTGSSVFCSTASGPSTPMTSSTPPVVGGFSGCVNVTPGIFSSHPADNPSTSHVKNTLGSTDKENVEPKGDRHFRWSIDQIAVLFPADIKVEEHRMPQYAIKNHDGDEEVDSYIDTFFERYAGVPTPMEDSEKKKRREQFLSCLAAVTHELGSTPKKKTTDDRRDVVCQTQLTIPPDVDLEKILGQYMMEDDCDVSFGGTKLNSSLRRKLFDHDSPESDHPAPNRLEHDPEAPAMHKTPPADIHLSLSDDDDGDQHVHHLHRRRQHHQHCMSVSPAAFSHGLRPNFGSPSPVARISPRSNAGMDISMSMPPVERAQQHFTSPSAPVTGLGPLHMLTMSPIEHHHRRRCASSETSGKPQTHQPKPEDRHKQPSSGQANAHLPADEVFFPASGVAQDQSPLQPPPLQVHPSRYEASSVDLMCPVHESTSKFSPPNSGQDDVPRQGTQAHGDGRAPLEGCLSGAGGVVGVTGAQMRSEVADGDVSLMECSFGVGSAGARDIMSSTRKGVSGQLMLTCAEETVDETGYGTSTTQQLADADMLMARQKSLKHIAPGVVTSWGPIGSSTPQK